MINGYETEELVKAHVTALLRELDQCERAGLADRAASIRLELTRFGHTVAAKPQERAEKRPVGRPRKDAEERTGPA